IPQKLFVVYRPLSNSFFDRLMYTMRARFAVQPVSMNQILRTLLAKRATPSTTAFIADQAPMPAGAYWTSFLNQDTPFFMGAEKIARKLNSPVVYVGIKKEKKGHYQIFAELLEGEPAQTAAGAITESFARHLEADICTQPETWLWSHRRWKHSRTAAQN